MAGAVPCDAALCVSYLEEIMANIKEIEALTNAFGPSGFEDEVIREVKNWCGGLDVANDAMYNVYATMKKKNSSSIRSPSSTPKMPTPSTSTPSA